MKTFTNICKKSQKGLKKYLKKFLKANAYDPISGDGFLYAKGDVPVLVTAHMDTVHTELPRNILVEKHNEKHIISSPQGIGGDDRCGIYIIMQLIKQGKRPYILFCEDEENGGEGSGKFIKTEYIKDLEKLNYLIELDRANANDAVFYNDGNELFLDYILEKTGYIENYGSFSDISVLCPACGVSGVNLSCGYYKAHTLNEFVVFEEMVNTIDIASKLIDLGNESEKFEYIESCGYYKGMFSSYDYYGYYSPEERNGTEFVEFMIDVGGNQFNESFEGSSFEECVGKLLMTYPNLTWDDVYDYYVY